MTIFNGRVGAIGLGYWGKNIVRNLSEIEALAALYDKGPNVRASFAAQYPEPTMTESVEAMLALPDLDAVMIATPAATHGDLVRQALAAGKHVFVEKPICLDIEEAEALAKQADDAGLILMVGHLLLYHPAFTALLKLVKAGELGALQYVYSNRASFGKFRQEENALWSFAPHDISMILSLTGRLPRKVVANGGHYLTAGVADITLSHLDFGDGLQAHIFVSWLHPFKDQRLVVVGEDGMVVFNDVAQGPEKLLRYRHQARWEDGLPVVSKADAEPVAYYAGEPLRRECEAFLSAIAGGDCPPSDAREALNVLRVLDSCQLSLNSGAPVSLPQYSGHSQ